MSFRPRTARKNIVSRDRLCGLAVCLVTLACHGEVPAGSPLKHAPTIVQANLARLPRPKLLATPEVRTLVGYTRRVLHLHDGYTLAVFSFSDSGMANWLFLIDSRDLSVRKYDMPNHDVGSHNAALGADGNIYFMPHATGRAYKFDTKSRQFSALPNIALPPGELTWDAIGDSRGDAIYFGTYPNACLVKYDIASGKAEIHPHVVPDATYVNSFSEDVSGIHCLAWSPGSHWLTISRKDFSVRPGSAPSAVPAFDAPTIVPPGESVRYPTKVGGRRFGIGWPSGRLLEFMQGGKAIERGNAQAPAELWFLEPVGDNVLVGISHYGALFRFDLATNRFTRGSLPNLAPAANAIQYLETVTPQCVIGSNYSQQNLFRIDPQSGSLQMFNSMIARVPGESSCAIGFGGKAYIGVYIDAVILEYDPARSFEFEKNPGELIAMHDHYDQTRPRDVATDGRHVFFTSNNEYGKLGGAIGEVDPATGHVDVYPHPVKDQNLPSIAYDEKTRTFWLSSDRWGQQHSAPPTQPTAVLAQWSPKTHKVVRTIAPWQPVDETQVLGCSDDGILVAAAVGQIALIDTASAKVLWQGAAPAWPISKIHRGADGNYYLLAGSVLYRWRFDKNTLTPLAITDGCNFLTEYLPGCWALANSASIYRVDIK